MQILNKTANVRDDVCFRTSSNSKIVVVNKENVETLMAIFEELKKEDKSVANIEDLGRVSTLERERRLVRVKKLESEERMKQNAGFVFVGSITTVGLLVMGLLIFMTIKLFVIG